MKHFFTSLALIATAAAMNADPTIDPAEWGEPIPAYFSDGWILPHFEKSGKWEVEVRKSIHGDRYLIADPYHQAGFSAMFPDGMPNTSDLHNIIIDCSDPEYVVMETTEIFTFKPGSFNDNSPQTIWAQTRAAYLEAASGYSPAALTEAGLNSTITNNVITLKSCVVGFSADAYLCGSTLASDGKFRDTTITLNNSGNIPTASSTEICCQPEYFTLTGQRVITPAPGSLLLIRRGATVTKTIIP